MNKYPAPGKRFFSLIDVDGSGKTDGMVAYWHEASNTIRFKAAGALDAIADQRMLGNVSGGSASPVALTQAQVRTFLGLATVATSGSASDLGTGTLPIARIGAGTVTDDKLAVSYLPDQSDPGSNTFSATNKLVFYDGTVITGLAGPGTARKRLASDASGVVEWRDEHKPLLSGTVRDLLLVTTNPVAWKSPVTDIDAGGRLLATEVLTSGEASLQTFTLRTGFLRVPDGFTAFKTTGAFSFTLVADDTSSANAVLTGYTVMGYTDREGAGTTLVTASGLTTAVTSASIPDVVSVDRSAFSSTTVPTWVVFEFELSVRSSKFIVVESYELASE